MTASAGHRYCIIGAGPSGLAQARAFARAGWKLPADSLWLPSAHHLST